MPEITFEQAMKVGTNVSLQSSSGHYVVGGNITPIKEDVGFFLTEGESTQVSHNHAVMKQPPGFTVVQQVYSSADKRYANSRD
jgi:hypothetical protein